MTDILKLADFIYARNTGGQYCGYVGSTLADIIHDLSDGIAECCYVLYEGEEITGALALDIYEVDNGQEDTEVWGPYYSDHPEEELESLFMYLKNTAGSADVRYIHLFISADNAPLIEYAARYRTEKVRTHYHYSIDTTALLSINESHAGLSIERVIEPKEERTEQIIQLHNEGFQGATFTEEDIRAEIENSRDSEYDIYAVLNGNSFTGYIIVRRNNLTHILHLEYICIRSEERSRGTGKQLITYLAEKYRGQGYRAIELDVSGDNQAAVRFYDTNGFSRVSVMKHIMIGGGLELLA